MAVRFTPKHAEDYLLGALTPQQFLVLATEATAKMEWEVGYISDNGLIAYTNNGMFSRNAEIKITVAHGVATIQSASTGSEMMDLGRNKKNVNAFIAKLEELRESLTVAELDAKYQELNGRLVPQEEDILKLPPPTTTEQINDFFSIFKPVPGFYITPILLDLNLLIFILMAFSGVNIMQPDNESLLHWGANFRPSTLDGEWWRLLTNCFLHIGIFHLLMNMYALLYIGILLEPHLGRTRFLSAYLLTGIAASLSSLWWHDLTISAGASGAIFGMYGVFLAMLTTDLIEKTARKAQLTSIAVFVGYNLIYGLKGGIDNAAHIGGLLSGLVIGYALIPSLKKPEENRLKYGTVGLLAILVLVSSFVVYKKMPNDIGIYEAKIQEFIALESTAMEVYKLQKNMPEDRILSTIKEKGIRSWKESITLIDGFSTLDLPSEIKARNVILKEYCELRLKSCELLYKVVAEHTDQYDAQMEQYNTKINDKINALSSQTPPE